MRRWRWGGQHIQAEPVHKISASATATRIQRLEPQRISHHLDCSDRLTEMSKEYTACMRNVDCVHEKDQSGLRIVQPDSAAGSQVVVGQMIDLLILREGRTRRTDRSTHTLAHTHNNNSSTAIQSAAWNWPCSCVPVCLNLRLGQQGRVSVWGREGAASKSLARTARKIRTRA